MTTSQQIFELVTMNHLAEEGGRFLGNQRDYLGPVRTTLQNDAPDAQDFMKHATDAAGGIFLFGIHYALALASRSQGDAAPDQWTCAILTRRDKKFYETQASFLIGGFEKFAQRAAMFAHDKNPILLDHMEIVASMIARGNDNYARHFRTGMLFGIELLFRIEEDNPGQPLRPN